MRGCAAREEGGCARETQWGGGGSRCGQPPTLYSPEALQAAAGQNMGGMGERAPAGKGGVEAPMDPYGHARFCTDNAHEGLPSPHSHLADLHKVLRMSCRHPSRCHPCEGEVLLPGIKDAAATSPDTHGSLCLLMTFVSKQFLSIIFCFSALFIKIPL